VRERRLGVVEAAPLRWPGPAADASDRRVLRAVVE
jgi:hypothetical protein